MLRTSASLINRPVLSIRLGGPIATASSPIINPHNLKVIGWWCKSRELKGPGVLLFEDVREVMPNGLAVNDDASISLPNELVRLGDVLNMNYQLVGKTAKTKRHKLGKISDYSYDEASLFIQKLYVSRPMVKLFASDDTLIIDRRQVLEVTDDYVLVEDTDAGATEEEPAAAPVAA